MNHALTYSILSHLKTQVTEVANSVTWIYDGVTLTGTAKPFLTVEQLTDINEVNAAGRTSYTETYTWQIGVFARNVSERTRLCDTVRTALRQRNIEFIDTRTVPATATTDTFAIDVGRTVPIPLDDVSDDTNAHRAYIDVEVTVQRVNADGLAFTQ
jgi:hypothetical protein